MSITYKDPNNTLLTGGVEPDNELWFYSSELFDATYENTLWFPSLLDQHNWFSNSSHMLFAIDNVKYAIKNEFSVEFRVPYNTEKFLGCGYVCRVKGRGTLNEKYWYYFIDRIDALSPNSSLITCTIDVIQTFMWDIELRSQQVERMLEPNDMDYLNDLMLTNEYDMPAIERCESYSKKNPSLSVSGIGSGSTFSRSGILVIATQMPSFENKVSGSNSPYGTFDTEWHRAKLCENTNNTFQDGSGLFYFYFNDVTKALKYLYIYERKTTDIATDPTATDLQSHLNAIKGIYGVPLICAGQWMSDLLIPETDASLRPLTYVAGYRVRPFAMGVNTTITIPTSLYGYTPNSKKALSSLCISIETRSGKSIMLSLKDCDIQKTLSPIGYYINLSIIGICSINPTILVFPHRLDTPSSLPTEDTTYKSSNFIKFSFSPSFSIYDLQGEQIYNAQYESAKQQAVISMISNVVGGVMNPASIPMRVGGMINTAISLNQLKETYNTPKNMIGDASEEDLWATDFNYLVVRFLAPCKNNFIGFDNDLSISGISYAGKVMVLSYTSDNKGVTLNGKNYFNYIKTVNCKVGGDVGMFKSKIESIFDNGIRFWNIANSTVASAGIGSYTPAILSGN